jgi:hypothetical protein
MPSHAVGLTASLSAGRSNNLFADNEIAAGSLNCLLDL